MPMAPAAKPPDAAYRPRLAEALTCAALTIVSLAPFATKAFHIDDTLFLYAARQISAHPADPFGFSVNWYGVPMPMSEVTQNGPLTSYYIALAASLLGWSEAALHLAFLLPAVAAVLGTYWLAAGLCARPLLAALATLLCPVFLVSSTTLMSDTMMLAFWVWAVVLWLRGAERGSQVSLALSACLMAAAAVTKYFAVALIPLLLSHSLLRWSRAGWRVLYLAIPLAAIAAYDAAMRSLYGHSMLYAAGSFGLSPDSASGSSYWARGAISLSFLGGCLATAIFYAPLLWSRRVLALAAAGVGLMTWLLSFVARLGEFELPADGQARLLMLLQFSVFAAAGVGLLSLAAADLGRSRDALSCLLALWMAGTFVFCWVFNWTVNARSILPMAPAACILMVRCIQGRARTPQNRVFSWALLPLAPLGLLSLAVAWADMRLADTARAAAGEIHQRYGAGSGGVVFAGHWGFQYYMESYGFTALDLQRGSLKPGDLLILPENNSYLPAIPAALFSETATLEWDSCPLLATMKCAAGAGFYASGCGPLPFAFGPVPPERYHILTLFNAEEALARGTPADCAALDKLARMLATRESAQGDALRAVSLAQRVCQLTDHKSPAFLDTLAAAYAAAGRFPAAVATAQKAIELASAAGQTELASQIETRLTLYQAGRPYREPVPPPAAK